MAFDRLADNQSFAETLGRQAQATVKSHAPDAALKVWDEVLGLRASPPVQAPRETTQIVQ
jgi:hypothetical protein